MKRLGGSAETRTEPRFQQGAILALGPLGPCERLARVDVAGLDG